MNRGGINMTFDDLVKEKTKGFNTKSQCPHCRTYSIIKYLVQGVLAGKRRQEAYCPSCNKRWYIVYDPDMKSAHIDYILSRPSVLGSTLDP